MISEDAINDLLNIVNVIPLTSRKAERRIYPNETVLANKMFGLDYESIVLCHQLRTLDKQRLFLKYGGINDETKREEIIEALCFQLGIGKGT